MVHKHLIIRAEVDSPIVKPKKAKEWLKRVVKAAGMNITKHGGPHVDYVEKDGNCGIAAIVMIETSHITVHFWDKEEPPLVQFDLYSCSDFNHHEILSLIYELCPVKINCLLIDRHDNLAVTTIQNNTTIPIDTSFSGF